jgi:hypothetical protein
MFFGLLWTKLLQQPFDSIEVVVTTCFLEWQWDEDDDVFKTFSSAKAEVTLTYTAHVSENTTLIGIGRLLETAMGTSGYQTGS